MTITPIVFVLVILLFGFEPTEQVKTPGNTLTAKKKLECGDSRKNSEIF